MFSRFTRSFVISALLLASLSPRLGAEEPKLLERKKDAIVVRYPPGAEGKADFVASKLPSILAEVTHRLMIAPPERVELTLLNSRDFERAVGPRRGEWAVAVAFSARNSIVVNLGKLGGGNDLYTILEHECVHLVLGRVERFAGRALPLWFQEGVAQWICGRLFAGSRDEFLVAAKTGRLQPLSTLVTSFPDSGKWVNIAYAQSESFVTFLERRQLEACASIIATFSRTGDFEGAVAHNLGAPLSEMEKEWLEGLRGGPPFVVMWMRNNPGALWILLFTFAALATVVAYFRLRKRRRQLMREWDAEGLGDED